LNPELRHRLGVNRYSSRGIQAERLARLARALLQRRSQKMGGRG
jgi:hypothetical protein